MFLEFFAKFSLVLLVFLLPLEARWIFDQADFKGSPFEYGTGALYFTDILLFVSVFLTMLWKWRNGSEKFPPKADPPRAEKVQSEKLWFIYILIAGFGLMSLAGIGQAEDRKIALFAVMRLWEGLILWWLIRNNPIRPIILIMTFAGTAALEAVWGMEQFFFQIVPANKWLGEAFHSASILGDSVLQTADGRFLRAYGTLSHPNMLGGMLTAAILLLCGLIVSPIVSSQKFAPKAHPPLAEKVKSQKLIFWVGLVILLFGLFFTFSRSAWLALVVGTLFGGIWMIAAKQKRAIAGIVFTIIVCAASIVLIFPESISRFSQNQSLEILSVSERTREYDDAQIVVRKKPFVGIGINQYVKELQDVYPSFPAWKIHPIHNIYLLALSELGIIGLLVFIIIIAWHLSFLKIKSPPLLIWSGSAIVSLLIIGLFDHYLWSLHFGIFLFWFVLGLLNRLENRNFTGQDE